jgi:hypothetical protein
VSLLETVTFEFSDALKHGNSKQSVCCVCLESPCLLLVLAKDVNRHISRLPG